MGKREANQSQSCGSEISEKIKPLAAPESGGVN